MSKSTNKSTRSRLTLKQKFDLINDHEDKMDIERLKSKYNCAPSTVYKIVNNKAKIIEEYLSTQNVGAKMKVRSSKFENINELTYNWFVQIRAKNLPVSGTMVQEKAKAFADEIGDKEFKASSGWLESFKNGHQKTWNNNQSKILSKNCQN